MIRNQADNRIQVLPSADSTTVAFRVEGLTCKISCFASNSFQSLHCKLEPDQNMMGKWNQDDSLMVSESVKSIVQSNLITTLFFKGFGKVF